jgi:hypothetical protein
MRSAPALEHALLSALWVVRSSSSSDRGFVTPMISQELDEKRRWLVC